MMTSFINIALSICSLFPSLSKTFSKWFCKHDVNSVGKILTELAKSVTGTHDEKDALEKLRNDPKLLCTMQETIIKTEAEIELALINDRQNARSRDVSLATSGVRNLRADAMVLVATLGLILCLIFIAKFQKDIPGEIIGIVSTVAGIFGACLKDAYSFEFGTSRNSFRYKSSCDTHSY